jgi:hypothetical protein
MNDALLHLLPLVWAFTVLGLALLGLSAALSWRKWPEPAKWHSKYGRVPPK